MSILRKFRVFKTIRSRIISIQLIIIIPSLLLLGMLIYKRVENLLIQSNSSSYEKILQSTAEILDANLKYYREISRTILSDDTLQAILTEAAKNTDNNYAESGEAQMMDFTSIVRLNNSTEQYITAFSGLKSMYLWDNNGKEYYRQYLLDSAFVTPRTSWENVKKNSWYQNAVSAAGHEIFAGYDVITGSENSFSCMKLIRSLDTIENIGLLVLTFDKEALNSVMPSYSDDKGLYMLIENDGNSERAVAVSGPSGDSASAMQKSVQEDPEKYYSCSYHDKNTGWELRYTIQKQDILKEAADIKMIIRNGLAVILLLLSVSTFVVCRRITRPLYQLEENIEKVGSGERFIDDYYPDDEIGRIGSRFAGMVNDKLALSDKISQIEIKNKQAELELLQSNINPHFLYNTLDTLYWMAIIEEADDIAELTKAMSNIFKIALTKGEKYITIEKELEFLKSYLYIQNIRFDGKINYFIQVDPALENYKIIKLLLQPFVENAVTHGLEPKKGTGTIRIHIFQEEKRIYFQIEDDGVGMEDVDAALKNGFAVQNSIERVKLIYGEEAEVTFASKKDEGTKVTISFIKEESHA